MSLRRSDVDWHRRPTMRDVATAAQVSLKTVSRVVNGDPGVSDVLLARVQRAIRELDYQPDDRARQLRRRARTTRIIGFVQVDMANPFFALVHRGIEDIAYQHGTMVISASSDESPERQDELLEALVGRRVDGLILVPTGERAKQLESELRRGTPLVCVDRRLPNLPCDTVVCDNRGAVKHAVEYLFAQGHSRIAFLGDDPVIWTARERLAGYQDALSANKARVPDGFAVTGVGAVEAASAAVRQLLECDDPPTALFTGQNLITIGALHALHDLRRQHDTALVGFDDLDLAERVYPAITVIAQDPYAMGRAAGELLFDRLGGNQGDPVLKVLPLRLIQRGSGEIPP